MSVATGVYVSSRPPASETVFKDVVKLLLQGGSRLLALAFLTLATVSCDRQGTGGPPVSPVYNKDTGKLEQLASDRDGDGRLETRAYMDGAVLKRIEIDRNGDGSADRWEYYSAGRVPVPGTTVDPPVISRVDEANGAHGRVTRQEFYVSGVVQRVEDDTDDDGRPDKWEWYESGTLARVELDLVGKGYPSQRLVYGAGGNVLRVETDPDGDGRFVPVPTGGAGN